MVYLIEFLLFLLPFGAYALWRRLNPVAQPQPATLLLAVVAIGLGLGAAVWYGLSVSLDAGTAYVPARLGADGTVLPGRPEAGTTGRAEVRPAPPESPR